MVASHFYPEKRYEKGSEKECEKKKKMEREGERGETDWEREEVFQFYHMTVSTHEHCAQLFSHNQFTE